MSDLPTPHSRRQFFGKLAQGAVAFGAAPGAVFSATNPFAYDVSRFGRTDPAMIGWEEISRRTTPLPEARRIAIGTGNIVHVAAGSEIVRWKTDGALPSLKADAMVTCLALPRDELVFAGLRDRIVSFDTEGRARVIWQAENDGSWFSGLAVSEHDIWIADSGLRVIWHCDRAGKVLGRVGQKDRERDRAGLVVPSPFLDVRLHPDGLLRVNNPGRHRVEAYTPEGDLEFTWGKPTAAVPGFCGCCNPIALAILPDGRIVTAEKGLPRVKVYASDGTFESVVAGTETFAENVRRCGNASDCTRGGLDVAVDSEGRIHILDRVTGEVRVMRPKARA